MADSCSADDEIESSEGDSSSERTDEVRVDARDFQVERKRAKQLENCLHERGTSSSARFGVGEVYADKKL